MVDIPIAIHSFLGIDLLQGLHHRMFTLPRHASHRSESSTHPASELLLPSLKPRSPLNGFRLTRSLQGRSGKSTVAIPTVGLETSSEFYGTPYVGEWNGRKSHIFGRSWRSIQGKVAKSILRVGQRIRGQLSQTDGQDLNLNSYVDDYVLRRVRPGQRIEINLRAKFDGYLQLLNGRTGRELLYGDDTSKNLNARMVFTAQKGVQYRIRVSSARPNKTGQYTLRSRVHQPTTPGFDFFYGYGLVDAAAAVAQAIGQPRFSSLDPLGGENWSLDLVNAPAAWAQGFTGQGVTIAVIDSGIDYNHPDLFGNLWSNSREIPDNGIDDDGNGYVDDRLGWNFVSNTNNPADDDRDGHGTHVAGIIAGQKGSGKLGVAYDAKIMPLKVLNRRGEADGDAVIAEAIRYAVNQGARVVNLSLGGDPGSGVAPELESALRFARDSGVVVVMASGNERQQLGALRSGDPAFFGAVRDLGISVGAIGADRRMYLDSNPAGKIPHSFVVAPGVQVQSTVPGGFYDRYDGTSMATPHVAGVVALMLSANPTLTPAQVEAILVATADRQGLTLAP
ncbi:S8 family peptidase [Egbenema bharatensis]|uniref:S8 family peptidase n=1 Tax=Egbenema bharatensis TaxID=3463334 RepID=UPI003A83ED10